MTNTDLTLYRERLLALRASLLGDVTQMEEDSLKDHCKTTSIPTDMEELGSDNADQELTVSLLESNKSILDQIEAAIERIEDGTYDRCEECGGKSPRPALRPSLMRPSASIVPRKGKRATKPPRMWHCSERPLRSLEERIMSMKLSEYFEKTQGIGVLATTDASGQLNQAIYRRPHFVDDFRSTRIMAPSPDAGSRIKPWNRSRAIRASVTCSGIGRKSKGLSAFLLKPVRRSPQ